MSDIAEDYGVEEDEHAEESGERARRGQFLPYMTSITVEAGKCIFVGRGEFDCIPMTRLIPSSTGLSESWRSSSATYSSGFELIELWTGFTMTCEC